MLIKELSLDPARYRACVKTASHSAKGAKCNSLGQRPRSGGHLVLTALKARNSNRATECQNDWIGLKILLRAFSAKKVKNVATWAAGPGFHISRPWCLKLLTITFAFLCAQSISAQTSTCVSADEIQRMLAQVTAHQIVPFNKKLSEQLIKLKGKNEQRLQNDVAENRKSDELMKRLRESRQKNVTELCGVLKEYGWPSKALVGLDGVDAVFFLIRDSAPFQLQIALLPVVVEATKLGDVSRAQFAAFVDLLRLRTGLKQLFGTQAALINGFLVLYPIEGEAQVDARRKQYGLGPLAEYLRYLEQSYRLPLIKSTGTLTNAFSDSARKTVAATTGQLAGASSEEIEVVRVETNLVNLNVSVYSNTLKSRVGNLEKEDFTVSEDGRDEALSYFGKTDVPFDLVLLIDLSGSTEGKRTLIQKASQRFIEAARPSDRLAIVTFADEPTLVTPLTEDRAKLLDGIKSIEGTGGSNVWYALKFTLDQVIAQKSPSRRRAVVFLTDGVDNSLGFGSYGYGPTISFADLVEAVRHSDTLIIPICLDTEGGRHIYGIDRIYDSARKALALLADESGGLYYQARRIEDLNSVYDQVIEDLGKVYSLGYRPTNDKHDGSWRTIKIGILNHPELQAKSRPGYYAN
jgi:Ca-activated chloride channel homolog